MININDYPTARSPDHQITRSPNDAVTCKTCGKKFDIPSQHSLVFIQQGSE